MCMYQCYNYMHIIVEHTYTPSQSSPPPPPQHLPQNLPNTPYVLEELVDNVCEEASSAVKLQLLTAVMKMFMKRPPECQEMLGRLLEHAVGQCFTSMYMYMYIVHVHPCCCFVVLYMYMCNLFTFLHCLFTHMHVKL